MRTGERPNRGGAEGKAPAARRRHRIRRINRLYQPVALLGLVAVVVIGGGFWARDTTESATSPSRTTAKSGAADDLLTVAGLDSGHGPPEDGGATAGGTFAGYAARPGMAITTPSQRIETVYAKREQSLADIARQRGVGVTALMWANTITEPDRPLSVGLAVRIPPKGTMLHRVRDTDTLESVARAYRVSADDILREPANYQLQSGDIVPGAFLVVPTTNPPLRDRVIFYRMREGDSLGRVLATYGLRDARTLMWANRLPDDRAVRPGQVVAVPPADGVIHVIEEEDTRRTVDDAVTQIAKNFACESVPCTKAPADARVVELREAIFAFGPNGVTRGGRLVPGRELMIPGGIPFVAPPPVVIPPEPKIDNPLPIPVVVPPPRVSVPASAPVSAPQPTRSPLSPAATRPPAAVSAPATARPTARPPVIPVPVPVPTHVPVPVAPIAPSGRPGLSWPESGQITTRFSSWHNGIDIAAPYGTPLRAAAAGRVVSAGWTNYGLGYAVQIDHGNGLVTIYGHMASVAVSPGQQVAQGQYIGPQGNTGNSTGPHVHFTVVQGGQYVNPLEYLR